MAKYLLIFGVLAVCALWVEAGFVTFDEFSNTVTCAGFQAPTQDQYQNFDGQAESQGSISSKEEAAMALANLIHESGGLLHKREWKCKDPPHCPGEYEQPDCDIDGQDYYGRGYIQLTWCSNYRDASNDLYGDDRLVQDPDSVARDEDKAWAVSFHYWKTRVHNFEGVPQGKFGSTIKAINGLECNDPSHPGPASRNKYYTCARQAFGIPGEGDRSGCP